MLSLSAADPAQPYGASLPWPANEGRPSRTAGAFVLLDDGSPAVFLERGAKTLTTFGDADPARWADALAALVKDGRVPRIELQTIDGVPVREHPAVDALTAAGFADGYRGLILRG
jgi:ATP-dependent Lhr-like helicase